MAKSVAAEWTQFICHSCTFFLEFLQWLSSLAKYYLSGLLPDLKTWRPLGLVLRTDDKPEPHSPETVPLEPLEPGYIPYSRCQYSKLSGCGNYLKLQYFFWSLLTIIWYFLIFFGFFHWYPIQPDELEGHQTVGHLLLLPRSCNAVRAWISCWDGANMDVGCLGMGCISETNSRHFLRPSGEQTWILKISPF